MGSPNAKAYLSSPEVVIASAIKGYIAGPSSILDIEPPMTRVPEFAVVNASGNTGGSSPQATEKTALLPGFPSTFSGPLVFAPQDNLNTDGIYPGKYTYQDDITLERQAEVVMENYDPSFASLIRTLIPSSPSSQSDKNKLGVILVSGFNFGTGSSREQAATALKSAGIPLVIAGSFGDIFKRNAINNGLICLECPQLVEDLTRNYALDGVRGKGGKKNGELTVREEGWSVVIDKENGKLEVQLGVEPGPAMSYDVRSVGASVQELWLEGGLEGFILKELKSQK